MKKQLLLIAAIFIATLASRGQAAFVHATGVAQTLQAGSVALDFNVQVDGQILIINFDEMPMGVYQVEVYDITGKRVASFKNERASGKRNEYSLDQALPRGLYIVRITAGKQAAAKKFQT